MKSWSRLQCMWSSSSNFRSYITWWFPSNGMYFKFFFTCKGLKNFGSMGWWFLLQWQIEGNNNKSGEQILLYAFWSFPSSLLNKKTFMFPHTHQLIPTAWNGHCIFSYANYLVGIVHRIGLLQCASNILRIGSMWELGFYNDVSKMQHNVNQSPKVKSFMIWSWFFVDLRSNKHLMTW